MKIIYVILFDDKCSRPFGLHKKKMIKNTSDLSQEKIEHDSGSKKIASKITIVQNIIKKKYKKALMNRLEHEGNVTQTINPHSIDAFGINDLSPNELCVKLKSLIDASIGNQDKKIHIAQINSIIAKLHDLDILV